VEGGWKGGDVKGGKSDERHGGVRGRGRKTEKEWREGGREVEGGGGWVGGWGREGGGERRGQAVGGGGVGSDRREARGKGGDGYV